MKKFVAVLLIMVLCLSLTGCDVGRWIAREWLGAGGGSPTPDDGGNGGWGDNGGNGGTNMSDSNFIANC